MTTTKIAKGHYQVTAAGRIFTVASVEFWTEGAEVGGWHLYEGDNYCQTFWTKAEAVAAAHKIASN